MHNGAGVGSEVLVLTLFLVKPLDESLAYAGLAGVELDDATKGRLHARLLVRPVRVGLAFLSHSALPLALFQHSSAIELSIGHWLKAGSCEACKTGINTCINKRGASTPRHEYSFTCPLLIVLGGLYKMVRE